ncbi:MAG TPA: glycosyltransferase [Pyrinomonadaceae bacterium]|jgi:glycosyltransferase involved in cell wall biosynthesis|nr:glycosyltransferase [Pyrinomonadaceae bacterium]
MGLEGKSVLFISYNGMLDPLGQTQVLPYLRELAKRGVKFTLLSFERARAFTPEGAAKCEQQRNELQSQGIEWHWLRYHQRPSVPATIYDVLAGIRKASSLIKRNRVEMIHARGHIPATIALALKKRFPIKMIFDVRGLMAEEYVDAEHWRKDSLPYRITKATERSVFAETDAVVTLTERIWPIIREWEGLRGRTPHHEVIPCCVDLDRFRFSEEERARRRSELGLTDQFTIVYSGSLDGWYLTEKMADFFASVLRRNPRAHLLWLTNGSHDRVRELMLSRAVGLENYSVLSAAAAEVPSYLAAADAGLAFIKRCVSKLASSPTKNGEYLACGLPLILNAGIGDSDALINDWKAGVLITEFTDEEFAKAAGDIEAMVHLPDAREKARSVAQQVFNLEAVGGKRYASLYERVLSS